MNETELAGESALLDYYAAPPAVARACRRCGRRNAQRRRGLCRPCYNTPGVREKYPSAAKACVGVGCGGYRPPDCPTSALPGSPEKVAVLEERARLGLALWHPRDAR